MADFDADRLPVDPGPVLRLGRWRCHFKVVLNLLAALARAAGHAAIHVPSQRRLANVKAGAVLVIGLVWLGAVVLVLGVYRPAALDSP